MPLNFYVGEVTAQSAAAKQMANEYMQFCGTLKDSVNSFMNAPLSGKTYDSAKLYFSTVYPTLASGFILVCEALIEAHSKFPEEFQSQVDTCDVIEDQLKAEIAQGQALLQSMARTMDKEKEPNQRLEQRYMGVQSSIQKNEEKLQRLYEFNASSPGLFADFEAQLANLDAGLAEVEKGAAWNPGSGTFDLGRMNMAWTKPIMNQWKDREKSKGNNLEVRKSKNKFGGTTYEIYRNGVFDEDATVAYNDLLKDELIRLAKQRIEDDKFGKFVSFVGTAVSFGGGIKRVISEIIGMAGNRLLVRFSDNSVGTIAISGGVAVPIAADSLTLKDLVQFSNNGKITSKTFGKPIEGRVDGKKSNIRVDAEPDGDKIQIQTGHGKRSPLDKRIKVENITDKASIYGQVPRTIKRAIGKGKLDELVDNIWKAYIWLKSK
jgi:hypothetical protein